MAATNLVPNLGDMPKLEDRRDDLAGSSAAPTSARRCCHASVRVDPSAERMAMDSALEAGVPLVLVNILRFRPFPTTLLLGPGRA